MAMLRQPVQVSSVQTRFRPIMTILLIPTTRVSALIAAVIPKTASTAIPITRVMLGKI
ncbi:hypothetical protein D3C80_2234250 [compost metagenome]